MTVQQEQQVPSTKGLSERQLRGTACAWCGTPVTTDTAVDLGPRPYRRLNLKSSWFPRACVPCAELHTPNSDHRGDNQ